MVIDALGDPSPLAEAPVALQLAEQAGDTKKLHVSRAVLERTEYFRVRLSGRWCDAPCGGSRNGACASDVDDATLGVRAPLRLPLPHGCSATCAEQLLLRLYFPVGMRYDWGAPDVARVLELARLADMLMVGPDIVEELQQLLRWVAARSEEALAMLREYCAGGAAAEDQLPAWLEQAARKLTGVGVAGSGAVAAALSENSICELVQSVCATGDAVASEALEHVLLARCQLSREHGDRLARLLAEQFQQRVHLVEDETIFGSRYTLGEGGQLLVSTVLRCFATAAPEHLCALAKALFFPLRGPELSSRQSRPTSPYRSTAATLLGVTPEDELAPLLSCIIDAGHFDALEASSALAGALAKVAPSAQQQACRALARLPKALETEGTWKLLSSVLGAAMPVLCADAQLELCHSIRGLCADLQYQLINGSLLQSLCPEGQVLLSASLAQVDARRLHSTASAALLAALCPEARRLLCAALVPTIHALDAEVQALLLAELRGDFAASENAGFSTSPAVGRTDDRADGDAKAEVRAGNRKHLPLLGYSLVATLVVTSAAASLPRLFRRASGVS